MPPIEPILKAGFKALYKTPPLETWGKFYRAGERIAAPLLHPQQLLSQDPSGKDLLDLTYALSSRYRKLTDIFKTKTARLYNQHGINESLDEKVVDLVEYERYNKKPLTEEILRTYPTNVALAARDHLKEIAEPIHRINELHDPTIRRLEGYFPHLYDKKSLSPELLEQIKQRFPNLPPSHFPLVQVRQQIEQELDRLPSLIEDAKSMGNLTMAGKLESQQHLLLARKKSLAIEESTLSPARYQQLPGGGFYGPVSEARKLHEKWGYRTDYLGVMNNYITGAMRKAYLDQYMPLARTLVKEIKDPKLQDYAFDYVLAQRGLLGAKTNLTINAALAQLFDDPIAASKVFSQSLNFTMRLQYLTKIGLSWIRFPVQNLSQPILTLLPLVKNKSFLQGYSDVFFSPTKRKNITKLAKDLGVISETDIRGAVTEAFGQGKIRGALGAVERVATWPAFASEITNRILTTAVGLRQAETLGLRGPRLRHYIHTLVDRTQFRYQREAMPLLTANPIGKVVGQFRTFTANYVNFLTGLARNAPNDPIPFLKALATLSALSGTAAFPMWSMVRNETLRRTGIDIGEANPVEYTTEMLGLTPGPDISPSLEPFNIPSNLTDLLGPTLGTITKLAFDIRQRPERIESNLVEAGARFSPPLASTIRGVKAAITGDVEARLPPSKRFPKGRPFGERPTLEYLQLRPRLETVRNQYVKLVGAAIGGKRPDLIRQYIDEAHKKGLYFGPQEMSQARAWATKAASSDVVTNVAKEFLME